MTSDMTRMRHLRGLRDDDAITADQLAELEELEARFEHGKASGPPKLPPRVVRNVGVTPRRGPLKGGGVP